MISYNPKDWARFILSFPKSDTFRKLLPWMIIMGLYAWGVAYLELHHFKLSKDNNLKNVSVLHSLLGFAISMLLVFRTNTAYDRWWEGRRQWGALVNSSRNLAIKLNGILPQDDDKNRSFFTQLIPRFALELKHHLQSEATRLSLDEKPHPEIPAFDQSKHVPNQVASLIMNRIFILQRQKQLTSEQLLILNNEATSLMEICGACERIKNTPIPFSYSSFIKKFIFLYIITLPIGYVFSLGYLIIPVVIFVFYVLGSLEMIAEEIEDPFGTDLNDLPMQRMYENIKRNVAETLA